MEKLSRDDILAIIQSAFWDKEIVPEEIYTAILYQKAPEYLELPAIYARLLESCDWYTLRKIFTEQDLLHILSDTVLNRIYPEDLKEKYRYARKILSSTPVSPAG